MMLTAHRMSFVGLMVLPLVAAAAGAGAMFFYMSPREKPVDIEPVSIAPLDSSIRAEASSTYTLTLAKFLKERCGATETSSLEAASEREEQDDPVMAALARAAAGVRSRTITTNQSCDYAVSEIIAAEKRAGGKALPEPH